MRTFEDCPEDVEELAIQYTLKRMSAQAANDFESHCAQCAACREELVRVRTIVQALGDATAETS